MTIPSNEEIAFAELAAARAASLRHSTPWLTRRHLKAQREAAKFQPRDKQLNGKRTR